MALEIFIKFDGVVGDSRGANTKGWAEVLSWQWAMTGNRAAPPDSNAGAPRMDEICVRKRIGADSPALMTLFAEGRSVARAELRAVPLVSKREAAQKYVALVLEDVRIASIVVGGAAVEDFFVEEIVLRFARVSFEHSSHGPSGPDRAPEAATDTVFRWNVSEGQPG